MNNEPNSPNRIELSSEERQTAQKKMTREVFRVMNLDEHSGVISRNDSRTTYTVDNLQYSEQGDFAFGGENGFDAAVTRAFPNHLGQVHVIRAHEEDVVEPFPDDAPGLVYIKNNATVEAIRVPQDVIDSHIDAINSGDELRSTREVIDQLFKD